LFKLDLFSNIALNEKVKNKFTQDGEIFITWKEEKV
jgi:hypothetical protein